MVFGNITMVYDIDKLVVCAGWNKPADVTKLAKKARKRGEKEGEIEYLWHKYKPLLKVQGENQTVFEMMLDTISGTSFKEVYFIVPGFDGYRARMERIAREKGEKRIKFVPQREGFLENIEFVHGIVADEEEPVMFSTADLPLVTHNEFNEFQEYCNLLDAKKDLIAPVTLKSVLDRDDFYRRYLPVDIEGERVLGKEGNVFVANRRGLNVGLFFGSRKLKDPRCILSLINGIRKRVGSKQLERIGMDVLEGFGDGSKLVGIYDMLWSTFVDNDYVVRGSIGNLEDFQKNMGDILGCSVHLVPNYDWPGFCEDMDSRKDQNKRIPEVLKRRRAELALLLSKQDSYIKRGK